MTRRTATIVLACTLMTFLAALLAGTGPGFQTVAKEKTKPVEEFTANFVDMSASGNITNPAFIRIESYSTDDEVKQYAQLLAEKGQMELHQVLSKLDKGFVRIGGSLGYPIAVARTRKTETGRSVFLISNRPFEGIALAQGLRSADYPFGVVELKLDGKNKGEGQIIGAAQIAILADGSVEIKSLGTPAMRLLAVAKR